jgi:hypothetical protein
MDPVPSTGITDDALLNLERDADEGITDPPHSVTSAGEAVENISSTDDREATDGPSMHNVSNATGGNDANLPLTTEATAAAEAACMTFDGMTPAEEFSPEAGQPIGLTDGANNGTSYTLGERHYIYQAFIIHRRGAPHK